MTKPNWVIQVNIDHISVSSGAITKWIVLESA